MKVSYRQLLEEHDEIECAADAIMDELERGQARPVALTEQLDELARLVEDHVELEAAVIETVDLASLSPPWATAWKESLVAFDQLVADWMTFLATWTRAAIERDVRGFHSAAEGILPRLRERIQLEAKVFYSTALQTGAIDFR